MPLLLHISALLASVCFAGLWQGLVIALMAIALGALMPRASAGLRHIILIALFAGAVVLPWIHVHQSVGPAANRGLLLAPSVAAGIALLWIAAICFRAGQLYLAWRHLCAVRSNAMPISVSGLSELRGGKRHAVLCSSPDVDSPSILGFSSPRLLLPEWMLPVLTEAELQQIVLHECEHLRRGDDWINLLLQVGIVISPLNPALLWLNRRICVQRELAVDAAVVSRTTQPLSYAACLTRLAEQRLERGRLRLALAAWERRSELVQRVHALLDRPSVWTRRQSAWAAGSAAAALLLVATGMARAPQFVHMRRSSGMIASEQPLTTVVPMVSMAALSQPRFAGMASMAHMVPASFHVKSRQPIRPYTKRKNMRANKRMDASTALNTTFVDRPENTPRMVRTRTALWQNFAGQSDSDQLEILPVRFINADFSFPYVAVPMSNGWLLIEI
jgi:beta-lactamase regulating signal transducer with metallopeptidase domain